MLFAPVRDSDGRTVLVFRGGGGGGFASCSPEPQESHSNGTSSFYHAGFYGEVALK